MEVDARLSIQYEALSMQIFQEQIMDTGPHVTMAYLQGSGQSSQAAPPTSNRPAGTLLIHAEQLAELMSSLEATQYRFGRLVDLLVGPLPTDNLNSQVPITGSDCAVPRSIEERLSFVQNRAQGLLHDLQSIADRLDAAV